jgi:hypothetical protein
MFIGTARIEDPLPGWHVSDDATQDNHQEIVCTSCWSHSNGGTTLESGARDWFYECRCKDGRRDAILKRHKH